MDDEFIDIDDKFVAVRLFTNPTKLRLPPS